MQCKELLTTALSSPCLDLSRKAISDLPEEIMEHKHLEVGVFRKNIQRYVQRTGLCSLLLVSLS